MTNKKGRVRLPTYDELEAQSAAELERRRRKRRSWPEGRRTRIAREVRSRKRLPPPVPEGKTLSEVKQMDPEDPAFRHRQGRPKKQRDPKDDTIPWKDAVREAKQRQVRARRARVRKWEAEVIVAANESESHPASNSASEMEIYDEEHLIATEVLSLEDWDAEELSRGYRRNRYGRFGPPPKYIPREVQQEAFRRLVKLGERELKSAYLNVVKELISLAHTADSEKVRLEAQKEIMNRLIGKVPEHLRVAPEAPWEDFLADSLEPVEYLPPISIGSLEEVQARSGAVDAPSEDRDAAAGPEVPGDGEAPAPERTKSKPKKKRPRKKSSAKKRKEV